MVDDWEFVTCRICRHRRPRTKVSDAQVRQIRSEWHTLGRKDADRLSRLYGVGPKYILRLVSGAVRAEAGGPLS